MSELVADDQVDTNNPTTIRWHKVPVVPQAD
jgi:hypothetical protein